MLWKWLWRYVRERERERETLWKVGVDSKYGSAWGWWCSNDDHGAHGLWLWKKYHEGLGGVSSYIRYEILI